jgi:hypothetical protein
MRPTHRIIFDQELEIFDRLELGLLEDGGLVGMADQVIAR